MFFSRAMSMLAKRRAAKSGDSGGAQTIYLGKCSLSGVGFVPLSHGSAIFFRGAAINPEGLLKSCPHCGRTSLKKIWIFPLKVNSVCIAASVIKRSSLLYRYQGDARQREPCHVDWRRASLVEIRAALALDSTGFNRELQKLSVSANQAERDFVFPAFEVSL